MHPKKERTVVYQSTGCQTCALKSSGSFARLVNDYMQRQSQALHERLRLVFLFAPPPMGGER